MMAQGEIHEGIEYVGGPTPAHCRGRCRLCGFPYEAGVPESRVRVDGVLSFVHAACVPKGRPS